MKFNDIWIECIKCHESKDVAIVEDTEVNRTRYAVGKHFKSAFCPFCDKRMEYVVQNVYEAFDTDKACSVITIPSSVQESNRNMIVVFDVVDAGKYITEINIVYNPKNKYNAGRIYLEKSYDADVVVEKIELKFLKIVGSYFTETYNLIDAKNVLADALFICEKLKERKKEIVHALEKVDCVIKSLEKEIKD